MFNRPKPGETEDDILAMQEAFALKLKNKEVEPSAKIINLRKHKTNEAPKCEAKQSKYTESPEKRHTRVTFGDDTLIDDQNVSNKEHINEENIVDDHVYYPTIMPDVLGDILEKNTHIAEASTSLSRNFSLSNEGGFPATNVRDKNIRAGSISIFAQQMKMKRSKVSVLPSSSQDVEMVDEKNELIRIPVSDKSAILIGHDASDIHNQNKNIISKMTEKEILEEKEKLASMIDPKLLDYIRSLRKSNIKSLEDINTPMKIEEVKTENITEECDSDKVADELSDSDIITHPHLQDWVHFDTLEKDKLQWIKYMNKNEQAPGDEPYEARFDFKGYLLPYTIDYNEETKTLFHHGEEPHRPGYSITELFQLSRSSVIQQRSLALSTMAGILEFHSIGIYDGVINIPLTKIFFVLRFALDENIPIILEPVLKGFRNMFYNRVDEACLDSLLGTEKGLFQPRLSSTKSEIEETESEISELKDFHLTDLDLIRGALRTDILVRLRYVLSVVKPNSSCVEYCLQILIRIARDAEDNVNQLFIIDNLMSFIVETYIPISLSSVISFKSEGEKSKITLTSLKLIRIVIAQSESMAGICYKQLKILSSLKNYIGNMITENVNMLKIQIESFYIWSSLLSYNLGNNELIELSNVLLRVLDNHIKRTDLIYSSPVIMHSHAAALITLLINATKSADKLSVSIDLNLINKLDDLIVLSIKKWTSQLCNLDNFTSGHLKGISSAFLYLSTILTIRGDQISNKIQSINKCLNIFLKSKGFHKISSLVIKSSNLLSSIQIAPEQKNTNLPGLSSSMLQNSQNLPPTASAISPINFISSFTKYILTVKDASLSLLFLQHENIYSYIVTVSSKSQLNLCDNWFTKIELDVLSNILCLSSDLQLSDVQKEIFYNCAFKLSYILTSEYKSHLEFLFKNIVFKKECFTTERLLRNLNFSDTNDILNNLPGILQCYISTLKLNLQEKNNNLTLSNWNLTILPRDWIYMPILGLYTKNQSPEAESGIAKYLAKEIEKQTKNIVIYCLEWIFVSEIYFPEITGEIGLTDRLCRLACVFLCDNSLFLDPQVKQLLYKCVKIIFETEKSFSAANRFNFDKPLLGVNNFEDLYTQLVDQFQSVSYGDPTFSACILVPLAQQHNIKWRKLVWSEYAGCLRALDCPEEMLCYPLEEYIQPAELDFSLLKCYHRALVNNQVRQGTIAYKIAHHHVQMAKVRQQAKRNQTDSS